MSGPPSNVVLSVVFFFFALDTANEELNVRRQCITSETAAAWRGESKVEVKKKKEADADIRAAGLKSLWHWLREPKLHSGALQYVLPPFSSTE